MRRQAKSLGSRLCSDKSFKRRRGGLMGDNGKIKNGIELKEAEGNCIQRIIKKILKRLSEKTEVWYSLSYDEEKHRYFDKEFLLKYLNENYLDDKNKKIYEKNLINDLITLKTYRDDVEQISNNQDHFNKILSLLLTCVTTIVGATGNKGNYEDKLLFGLMIAIVYINMIYNVFRTTSNSESYKLKFITNAIYTLETIKEDMYRNGNWCTKSDEIKNSVNDRSDDCNTEDIATEDADDGNTEDIATEDADERYEGLELTEVKEIRTYTYKATKNKYSPRAMYERKRR